MKEEIQKAVLELISKSAVEIDNADRQTIVDEAIRTALEHIAETVNTVPLAKGSPYMNIWVRFGMSPELPGVGQKRAAMVAFTSKNQEGMKVMRAGAWYNGRIIFTNAIMCRPEEELENSINLTIKSIAKRADVEDDAACAALVSIMEQDDLEVRTTDLITPPGILDLVASGETNKAIARIREMEYGTICDMCLVIRLENGVIVRASGIKHKYLDEIWYNQEKYRGRIVEVHCHEKTPDGSLRHPRLKWPKCLRDTEDRIGDKD